MAPENENQNEQQQQAQDDNPQPQEKSKGGLLSWIIPIVIAIVLGCGGFLAGRFVSSSKAAAPQQTPQEQQQTEPQQQEKPQEKKKSKDNQNTDNWYHDLEPVVATLNEPGTLRYARTTLTLEIDGSENAESIRAKLDARLPVMNNWLTIYLASMSLEDVRGEQNLRRMQTQIKDSFNEKVFEEEGPVIKNVLFREFAIQ